MTATEEAMPMVTETDPPGRQAEHERIECRRCGQLIAKRWTGGGLTVVVVGQHIDREGRIVVECPSCGLRTRLQPHKFRAA